MNYHKFPFAELRRTKFDATHTHTHTHVIPWSKMMYDSSAQKCGSFSFSFRCTCCWCAFLLCCQHFRETHEHGQELKWNVQVRVSSCCTRLVGRQSIKFWWCLLICGGKPHTDPTALDAVQRRERRGWQTKIVALTMNWISALKVDCNYTTPSKFELPMILRTAFSVGFFHRRCAIRLCYDDPIGSNCANIIKKNILEQSYIHNIRTKKANILQAGHEKNCIGKVSSSCVHRLGQIVAHIWYNVRMRGHINPFNIRPTDAPGDSRWIEKSVRRTKPGDRHCDDNSEAQKTHTTRSAFECSAWDVCVRMC